MHLEHFCNARLHQRMPNRSLGRNRKLFQNFADLRPGLLLRLHLGHWQQRVIEGCKHKNLQVLLLMSLANNVLE